MAESEELGAAGSHVFDFSNLFDDGIGEILVRMDGGDKSSIVEELMDGYDMSSLMDMRLKIFRHAKCKLTESLEGPGDSDLDPGFACFVPRENMDDARKVVAEWVLIARRGKARVVDDSMVLLNYLSGDIKTFPHEMIRRSRGKGKAKKARQRAQRSKLSDPKQPLIPFTAGVCNTESSGGGVENSEGSSESEGDGSENEESSSDSSMRSAEDGDFESDSISPPPPLSSGTNTAPTYDTEQDVSATLPALGESATGDDVSESICASSVNVLDPVFISKNVCVTTIDAPPPPLGGTSEDTPPQSCEVAPPCDLPASYAGSHGAQCAANNANLNTAPNCRVPPVSESLARTAPTVSEQLSNSCQPSISTVRTYLPSTMATQTEWNLWGSPDLSGSRCISARNGEGVTRCQGCEEWREFERQTNAKDEQTQVKLNKLRVKQIEGDNEIAKLKMTVDSMGRQIAQMSMWFHSESLRQQNPSHYMYANPTVGNPNGYPVNWYAPPDLRADNSGFVRMGVNDNNGLPSNQPHCPLPGSSVQQGSYGHALAPQPCPVTGPGRNNVNVGQQQKAGTNSMTNVANNMAANPAQSSKSGTSAPGARGSQRMQVPTPMNPASRPPPASKVSSAYQNSTVRPSATQSSQGRNGNAMAPQRGSDVQGPSRAAQGRNGNATSTGTGGPTAPPSVPAPVTSAAPTSTPTGGANGVRSLDLLSDSWADDPVSDAELVSIVDCASTAKPTDSSRNVKASNNNQMTRLNILKEAMNDVGMRGPNAKNGSQPGSGADSTSATGKKGEKRVMDAPPDQEECEILNESYADMAAKNKWQVPSKKQKKLGNKFKNVLEGGNSTPITILFVNNLNYAKCRKPEDLEKLVKLHCKAKGVHIVFAKAFPMRYDEDSANCKVSIREYDLEKVLADDFWPPRASARLWVPSEIYNQKFDKGNDDVSESDSD